MKFIGAFLETLLGLITVGLVGWVLVVGEVADSDTRKFWVWFMVSLVVDGFLAMGVLLIIDGIRHGNK